MAVQNIDALLEKIDNRTVYAVGAGAIGFFAYFLTDVYLRACFPVLETGKKIEGQIGEYTNGGFDWVDMGPDPVTGGRIVKKVPRNG